MSNICKYKSMFGEPNTGIHKYRLFGVAIWDVIFTIIGGCIISWYFKYPLGYTLVILFLLGIFMHRLFCVRTTVDKFFFPDE